MSFECCAVAADIPETGHTAHIAVYITRHFVETR
jgi:hypothetical protein